MPKKITQQYDKIDSNPNQVILIAEQNKKIVGTISLFIKPKILDNTFEGILSDMAISQELQLDNIKEIEELIISSIYKIAKKKCNTVFFGNDVRLLQSYPFQIRIKKNAYEIFHEK